MYNTIGFLSKLKRISICSELNPFLVVLSDSGISLINFLSANCSAINNKFLDTCMLFGFSFFIIFTN